MSLSSTQRRQLAARGHHLKATVTVCPENLSEAVLEHVRRVFAQRDLLKVRINSDKRDACDSAAATLAEKLPCELVQRIGHVVLLYRPGGPDAQSSDVTQSI